MDDTSVRDGPCTGTIRRDGVVSERMLDGATYRPVYAGLVSQAATVPRLTVGVRSEWFDDEVVVLSVETGDLHHLDRNATLVWALIDGERTVEAIVREVAAIVDVPLQTMGGDVRAVLDQLCSTGLLVLDRDAAP